MTAVPERPRLIAFDVVETLFALEPVRKRPPPPNSGSPPDVTGSSLLEVVQGLLA